ncbi:MAG: serine O-acetyltransferase, partial [Alphaproteobacteria bacterium]|nr:serine O-acetyltransferase [Alphaproteobacteria bacterium]
MVMPFKRLKDEIDGYLVRDPAASSRLVILLTYPGLHALLWYRLANWLWLRRLILLGRLTSNFGRLF